MRFLILLALALLAGCSSIYHKQKGWVPEGYSDKQLTPTEYTVSFESYQGESWKELHSLVLYRAAQIGSAHHFAWLSIKHLKKKQHYAMQTTQSEATPFSGVGPNDNYTPGGGVTLSQYTMDYKIRRMTAVIRYSKEKSIGKHQLNVARILKHKPDY